MRGEWILRKDRVTLWVGTFEECMTIARYENIVKLRFGWNDKIMYAIEDTE